MNLLIDISTIMLEVYALRVRNVFFFYTRFRAVSSFLAMGSTSRCAVSSSCLMVFASPDSAGGGLGRARAVSLRGVLFSHLC